VAQKIAQNCDDPTKLTLVAVSRGGLVPTQLIAYKLDARDIRVLKLASYDDENHRGEICNFSTDRLEDDTNVWFIDDLADSGATVRYIRQHYPHARIGTLLSKSRCTDLPDVCAQSGLAPDVWLMFPWDM
jgi:xanthine phosphoribosyltransferase